MRAINSGRMTMRTMLTRIAGLATVTAIRQPARFGALRLDDGRVAEMREKAAGDGNWINGGFFVLEPDVIDRIEADDTVWEHGPMESLAADGELTAYQHHGFWQPMDTLRERNLLEQAWMEGRAPWNVWS